MIKVSYLEQPTAIPLIYLSKVEGERTFVTNEDIYVTLSDGREILIPTGTDTDLASVPKWAWSLFSPIDKAFIADLIHDFLWVNKSEEIKHFDNSIYEARKFADEERTRWRKAIAPEKRIKNFVTHWVIRIVGSLFYTKRLKIPY